MPVCRGDTEFWGTVEATFKTAPQVTSCLAAGVPRFHEQQASFKPCHFHCSLQAAVRNAAPLGKWASAALPPRAALAAAARQRRRHAASQHRVGAALGAGGRPTPFAPPNPHAFARAAPAADSGAAAAAAAPSAQHPAGESRAGWKGVRRLSGERQLAAAAHAPTILSGPPTGGSAWRSRLAPRQAGDRAAVAAKARQRRHSAAEPAAGASGPCVGRRVSVPFPIHPLTFVRPARACARTVHAQDQQQFQPPPSQQQQHRRGVSPAQSVNKQASRGAACSCRAPFTHPTLLPRTHARSSSAVPRTSRRRSSSSSAAAAAPRPLWSTASSRHVGGGSTLAGRAQRTRSVRGRRARFVPPSCHTRSSVPNPSVCMCVCSQQSQTKKRQCVVSAPPQARLGACPQVGVEKARPHSCRGMTCLAITHAVSDKDTCGGGPCRTSTRRRRSRRTSNDARSRSSKGPSNCRRRRVGRQQWVALRATC